VEGKVIADPEPRLCFGFLESSPPQCAAPSISLADLGGALDGAIEKKAPGGSEVMVRYFAEDVVVRGLKNDGVLQVGSIEPSDHRPPDG
jgi:hypothetical protein